MSRHRHSRLDGGLRVAGQEGVPGWQIPALDKQPIGATFREPLEGVGGRLKEVYAFRRLFPAGLVATALRGLDVQVAAGEFGVLDLAGRRRCEFDDATASAAGAEQIPLTAGQLPDGFVFPELPDGFHKKVRAREPKRACPD